jgi:hypothetical protein
MKTYSLLLAIVCAAVLPVSALAKIERVIEKSFAVSSGGQLTVETEGGNVSVQTGGDSAVKVVARQTIRASSEREADELLERLKLTIEQNGNDVTARAKYDRKGWGRNPVTVDFTVTVPARYNVTLGTSGGDVRVADLEGKVRARTSGGNITLGKIGGTVDANTSGGNVSLVEGSGRVSLETSGGNIRVERSVGETILDTSGGDIEVKSVEGTLHAETSGGNVTAGIEGALKGDCVLDTSGGRVKATVDKAAAFALDASTSGGDVRADGLTITISGGGVGKSKLSGKVNGGGPLLKLHSSGGDIVIATR